MKFLEKHFYKIIYTLLSSGMGLGVLGIFYTPLLPIATSILGFGLGLMFMKTKTRLNDVIQ